MFESMAHFNLDDFTHYFSEGLVMGPSSRPHVSQSYVFECHDGKWLALHMSSPPKFWENLAQAVGRPDMLHMPQFATREARIENYEHVIAFLAPLFAEKSRDQWCAELQALEVPHSPVRTSAEVAASAQAQALGMVLTDPDGPKGPWRTIRSPVSFDGERMTDVSAPPVLGAETMRPSWRRCVRPGTRRGAMRAPLDGARCNAFTRDCPTGPAPCHAARMSASPALSIQRCEAGPIRSAGGAPVCELHELRPRRFASKRLCGQSRFGALHWGKTGLETL